MKKTTRPEPQTPDERLLASALEIADDLQSDAGRRIVSADEGDEWRAKRDAGELALTAVVVRALSERFRAALAETDALRKRGDQLLKELQRAHVKAGRATTHVGAEPVIGADDDEPPAAGARCRHAWTPPAPDGTIVCSKCGAAKKKQGRPSNASKGATTATVAGVTKEDPPTMPLPAAPPPPPVRVGSVAADKFKDGPV